MTAVWLDRPDEHPKGAVLVGQHDRDVLAALSMRRPHEGFGAGAFIAEVLSGALVADAFSAFDELLAVGARDAVFADPVGREVRRLLADCGVRSFALRLDDLRLEQWLARHPRGERVERFADLLLTSCPPPVGFYEELTR